MLQPDMRATHCGGKYSSDCIVQQEFSVANIANRLHQHTNLDLSINPDWPKSAVKKELSMYHNNKM